MTDQPTRSELTIDRPWAHAEPATFRLAGFGGAALYMRTVVIPDPDQPDRATIAYDLTLHSPDSDSTWRARPASPGLPSRMAEFFFRAAADWHPENTLPAVTDERLGLSIDATSSTDDAVTLDVAMHAPGFDDEPEMLQLETTRAALAQAAQDVRALNGPDAEADNLIHF